MESKSFKDVVESIENSPIDPNSNHLLKSITTMPSLNALKLMSFICGIGYDEEQISRFIMNTIGHGNEGVLFFEDENSNYETDREGIIIVDDNFFDKSIDEKFRFIILFLIPPIADTNSIDLYLDKCLDLLDENGKIVALVPNRICIAPAYIDLRDRIISEFSLETVVSIPKEVASLRDEYSILVIEKRAQADHVYMMNRGNSIEEIYNGYVDKKAGFLIAKEEIYNRFDANFYDIKYTGTRNLIRNKDTVKISNVADIDIGIRISSDDFNSKGKYLVINSKHLSHGVINFRNDIKKYCDSSSLEGDKFDHGLLKNGDILISLKAYGSWARYYGDDGTSVVDSTIAIIRPHEESRNYIDLFFNTKTGIEYLESQLDFFSHCSIHKRIPMVNIKEMVVPNIDILKTVENVDRESNIADKISFLFKNLGWDVRKEFIVNGQKCDIALFYKNDFKGVVDINNYKETQIRDNRDISTQLKKIKERIFDVSLFLFIDEKIYEYVDNDFVQLSVLPTPSNKPIEKIPSYESVEYDQIKFKKMLPEDVSLADSTIAELLFRFDEIKEYMIRVEGKIDDISEKIDHLSKQISSYQSLVDKQLELAVSSDEEDRIIHAFSEECTNRIIGEIDKRQSNKEYNLELQKLIMSFGESAWNKLENSSKIFLVSSKVMFNNLICLDDVVDYSGVCLLVTKALELEMGRRFCKNFIAFLKQKYPGKENHQYYPSALLDKFGHPIKPKQFTLGTVAYVLCYLNSDGLTEEQILNNKSKLVEYSKEKLLSKLSDDQILETLADYGEAIEEVKKNYRNPSAHTNQLKKWMLKNALI